MTVKSNASFTHRVAGPADIPAIEELMAAAIAGNMAAFLDAAAIEAARQSMGVDRTLIEDGTYFVIETTRGDETLMVGCGGWGKRRTLFGGDQTSGRDDRLCDPATDAARIRAMYTHPDFVRQGIGTLLLELGEAASRAAGFRSIELGSTVPGEPLYLARGYREFHRETRIASNGVESVIIHMRKRL